MGVEEATVRIITDPSFPQRAVAFLASIWMVLYVVAEVRLRREQGRRKRLEQELTRREQNPN